MPYGPSTKCCVLLRAQPPPVVPKKHTRLLSWRAKVDLCVVLADQDPLAPAQWHEHFLRRHLSPVLSCGDGSLVTPVLLEGWRGQTLSPAHWTPSPGV